MRAVRDRQSRPTTAPEGGARPARGAPGLPLPWTSILNRQAPRPLSSLPRSPPPRPRSGLASSDRVGSPAPSCLSSVSRRPPTAEALRGALTQLSLADRPGSAAERAAELNDFLSDASAVSRPPPPPSYDVFGERRRDGPELQQGPAPTTGGQYFGYHGQYQNNAKEGFGTFSLGDGSFFVGDFFRGGEITGHGTRYWADGSSYTGEFLEGELHGQGTYHGVQGEWYEGDHRHGCRHGHGRWRRYETEEYTGEFRDHRPHGTGILVQPGRTVRGTFKRGLPDGSSVRATYDSGMSYTGPFKDGVPHGEGGCFDATPLSGVVYGGPMEEGVRAHLPTGLTLATVSTAALGPPQGPMSPVHQQPRLTVQDTLRSPPRGAAALRRRSGQRPEFTYTGHVDPARPVDSLWARPLQVRRGHVVEIDAVTAGGVFSAPVPEKWPSALPPQPTSPAPRAGARGSVTAPFSIGHATPQRDETGRPLLLTVLRVDATARQGLGRLLARHLNPPPQEARVASVAFDISRTSPVPAQGSPVVALFDADRLDPDDAAALARRFEPATRGRSALLSSARSFHSVVSTSSCEADELAPAYTAEVARSTIKGAATFRFVLPPSAPCGEYLAVVRSSLESAVSDPASPVMVDASLAPLVLPLVLVAALTDDGASPNLDRRRTSVR